MRRWPLHPVILTSFAALIVVLPLMVHGCSCGHDFDFHLISWMEAAAQFRAGVWHPSWAFSPAWNAGEPRFVFYPPVSWTLGALLGIALPWGSVPIAYTWLALAAARFAMYRLALELEALPGAAAIAAAVYVANPYMIFTAYERTAYAELLSAAWIPLLLAAILRERVSVLRIAVPVALLWLTNAPAAVMGCYTLAVLAIVRLVLMWSTSTARQCAGLMARAGGGVVLGLGLAAFYVLPAAYERRWVQIAMAMVEGMRIGDNFLFHHTSDALHDQVLHTASVIAVFMLIAAVVVFVSAAVRMQAKKSFEVPKRAVISLALLAAIIGLLLTPPSAAVWRIAPEMAFLQFPWRLTAVLAAAVCALIPLALRSAPTGPWMLNLAIPLLVTAMSWPMVHQFRQACDDEDNVTARLGVFNAKTGTDPTDEYTPGESDNDASLHANPAYWLAENGDAQPIQANAAQVPMHFSVNAKVAETLVLNLRDYPAWRVRINGAEVKNKIDRADGLIAFPVIAGHSQIDISYGMTQDRRLGDGISLIAVCGAVGLVGLRRRQSRSRIIEDG